jgi:O-antigen ligase
MLIICTRPVSQWLNMFGVRIGGATSLEEGSPLDAAIFFTLIASALIVLSRRGARLTGLGRGNEWVALFLLYCLLSVLWSDFPFVAFKRWIKVLGHPIMVFLLFSEPDFAEAMERLMKRCAYIVAPVSILFIKYYPVWGRKYDPWSGIASNTGITTDKNILGCVCLILGYYFGWHLMQTWRRPRGRRKRKELMLTLALLFMLGWLLKNAHSSTSLVSLLLAAAVVLFLGMRSVNKRLIGAYVVVFVIGLAVAQWAFDVFAIALAFLGKHSDLTGRAEIWKALLAFPINPVLGTGFESFWLGPRLQKMAELYWWHPNEAHNGYLELYLTLGVAGLLIFAGVLFATFRKCRLALLQDFEWGRFRMGFLAAVVVYNWTEASFKALHPVWFMFFVIALDYPRFGFGRGKGGVQSGSQDQNEPFFAEAQLDSPVGTRPNPVFSGR